MADASRDGNGSAACTLGTPDHCGTCTTVCPGIDSASTQRTCSGPTATAMCNILCKGEFYDLDGDPANGCEVEDVPVQDSAGGALALTLPNTTGGTASCNGATNPCTHVGKIYSDTRVHETAPTSRVVGREDWYAVTAVGAGTSGMMLACLGIVNYPADNQYEVCIGNAGSMTPTTCMTVTGGSASKCVAPPTAADTGTFYIRISKLAGTNTPYGYALFLSH
jgi:hypothetical protein